MKWVLVVWSLQYGDIAPGLFTTEAICRGYGAAQFEHSKSAWICVELVPLDSMITNVVLWKHPPEWSTE